MHITSYISVGLVAFASLALACKGGGTDSSDTGGGGDAVNLIENGSFDSDTTGWTAGSNAVLSVEDGQLRVETLDVGGGPGLAYQVVTLEPNANYTLTAVLGDATYQGSNHVRVGTDINLDDDGYVYADEAELHFDANATQIYVTCNNVAAAVGEFALFDDIVLTADE